MSQTPCSCAQIPVSVMDAWLGHQLPGAAPLPERLQLARMAALRAALHHAFKNSRWYGRSLAGHKLDIASEAELRLLPFTRPHDLADHRNFLCLPQGDVCRIVTLPTSGSSGKPKRIAFSDGDLQRTIDFFRAGMTQLVHEGQRLMVLLPGADSPNGVADLLRQAMQAIAVDVCCGEAQTSVQSIKADIVREKPQALVAAPHQLAILLEALKTDAHFQEVARCIDGIQSSGDILERVLRSSLEKELDCIVLDHFGMTETCFGGGVECLARCGYHLRELDLFIEILDPLTLEPAPEGSIGELVLTTLNREAMPLIRYRTGDASAWLTGKCQCGSQLRRLAPLSGRWQIENGRPVLRHVPKGGVNARTVPATL